LNLAAPLTGLVASLGHPGGQVTGITAAIETGKHLELLHELAPAAARIGILGIISGDATSMDYRRRAEAAASTFGLSLVHVSVGTERDLDAAFQTLLSEHVEGLLVPLEALFANERKRIAQLAATARLPTIYSMRAFVEDGGLMSYGSNGAEDFRHAAALVSKVLKGQKPADLPVERPTKYELVISLKTAKALGLTIPPALLARADEIIE
jgi:ABC-type uncharacterized transport system substrate-binding protein